MKIGVIGAMDCEIEVFCSKFCAKETDKNGIFKGEYAGHEIYICLCGVGKVNAACSVQRLCDLFGVEVIINSGVAGDVDRALKICDVAISDSLTYYDFTPIDILDRYPPFSSVFMADKKLVELSENACEKINAKGEKFGYKTGLIVTGDRFVEDSAFVKELYDKYKALCTEMEGAAIAHAAILNNVPFVVIRAISDNADADADMSFEQMKVIGANRAGVIVTDIIENI